MSPPAQKRPKDLAGYLEAVIRSRPKIEAVIDNARTIVELDTQHHGFRRYLRSHSDFDALVADLKREFRFVGDSGAYHFLYIVNEPVPAHEEWMAGRKARPAARQAGRSAAGRKP